MTAPETSLPLVTKRPRVLLAVHTFSNSYVHLPAFLADAGLEIDLVTRPGNALLASRLLRKRYVVQGNDLDFAAFIGRTLAARDYDAFQIVDEPALVAVFRHSAETLDLPYLPFSELRLRKGTGSKVAFHSWCNDHGLPTPRTTLVKEWPEIATAIATTGQSCVVKGDSGSGGCTVRFIESPEQVESEYSALANHGPWLVQEKVPGPTGCVQLVAHRGRLLGWFAIYKRLALGSGRGPTLLGEFCAPEGMEEICRRASEAGGLNGLHGFDFMLSPEGKPLLIDPHLGRCTTMQHLGPFCGVNLAELWRDALLDRPSPIRRPQRLGDVFVKFPELLEYYFEHGYFKAWTKLRPWRHRLNIFYGDPRDFSAVALATLQILMNRLRILGGALRQKLIGSRDRKYALSSSKKNEGS